MNQYIVTIARKGKTAMIIMRDSDFEHSTVLVKDEIKMYWGSGPRWTVVQVVNADMEEFRRTWLADKTS